MTNGGFKNFVHRYALCLRILCQPRVLVWLRRDAPALLMLPGFIIAQIFPVFAMLLCAVAVWRKRWHLAAALVLGSLSAPTLPFVSLPAPEVSSADTSYLVRVADLRYPKVGAVQFTGYVLGSFQSAEADLPESGLPESLGLHRATQQFVPLRTPYLAKFRGIHLAWRNANFLENETLITVRAKLSPVVLKYPWSFDAHLHRHGILAVGSADLISEPLSDPLLEKRFSSDLSLQYRNEAHGILWSLAIGSRDAVSQNTERIFRNLGLSHALVFSGFQVVLVGGLTQLLARYLLTFFLRSLRADIIASFLGLLAAVILTSLSGWEPSGIRAVLALLYLTSTNLFCGSATSSLQRLSTGVIGISLIFPGAMFEPGVQLTFAALLGLIISPAAGFVVPAICATMFTSFVALFWFGQWAPVALVLNPLVAPLLTLTGCLLAYPLLIFQALSLKIPIINSAADFLVQTLGELNLFIMRALDSMVPNTFLLEPTGGTLILTYVLQGLCVLTLIMNATIRYLMLNGVAFRNLLNLDRTQ